MSIDVYPLDEATETTLLQILNDTNNLPAILTAVNDVDTNTDGLEALSTAANALLTTINAAVADLDGNTDGIEALITATNALITSTNALLTTGNATTVSILAAVDQLEGYLDTVEALITSTNALLTTGNATAVSILAAVDQLEGYLDTVETLITATNTKLDTLIAAPFPLPLGYQQLTVPAASTALTVPATSKRAVIQCEDGDVRWRDDGVAPTAAIGMRLESGSSMEYTGSLSAIRFIRRTGASGTLNISYYDR